MDLRMCDEIEANFMFQNLSHYTSRESRHSRDQLRRTTTNLEEEQPVSYRNLGQKRMNKGTTIQNVLEPYGCVWGRKFSGILNHMMDLCHYLTRKVSTSRVIFVILQWYIGSEALCKSEYDQITVNDKSTDGRRARKWSVSMHYLGPVLTRLGGGG
jgi:hypothetical protein